MEAFSAMQHDIVASLQSFFDLENGCGKLHRQVGIAPHFHVQFQAYRRFLWVRHPVGAVSHANAVHCDSCFGVGDPEAWRSHCSEVGQYEIAPQPTGASQLCCRHYGDFMPLTWHWRGHGFLTGLSPIAIWRGRLCGHGSRRLGQNASRSRCYGVIRRPGNYKEA